VPNFCAVGLGLVELGYMPVGIRLDSGDLAYQSVVVRDMFKKIATTYVEPIYNDVTAIPESHIF